MKKANWSIGEDVKFFQVWVLATHMVIVNDMRVQHMWNKIHAQLVEQTYNGTFQHNNNDTKFNIVRMIQGSTQLQ